MDAKSVVQQAEESGVQLINFLFCDNAGIIRGKATHASSLEKRLESGMGLTKAMPAMTGMDDLQAVDGFGPVGEVRLIPDLDTFTILPYAPTRALALADMITTEREPWGACPRSFLKRMIEKARGMGVAFQAAMEPEWYLAREEDGEFVPMDESLDNATIGLTAPLEIIDDVVASLTAQGLQVEQYYPELGHGQQEMSITHADALRAADNHIIYRETVRNVAWKHGWLASFAPKPFPDQAGNGCHTHLSAWDLDGETNLFYDADDELGISEMAYRFIGGILEHMPALMALAAPSVNSYRRISPGSWSTAFVCYGPDNREAALRIPSRFWGSEMASTNLEFRPADSSSNPYILLGGLIAAGLDGIERELTPPKSLRVDVDPSRLSAQELAERGIERLPESLLEATAALESNSVLTDALGPMLTRSYLAIRRAEWDLFSSRDAEFEIRQHFYKY